MASNVAVEMEQERLAELDRLELALRRLFDAHAEQRRRAAEAEARAGELQAALDGVRTGALDPRELGARVRDLEAENRMLRERIRSAEAVVQRIQSRLQLLEEER